MLEVLRFIFSDFWIFAGTVLLIYVIGSALNEALSALRKR